MPGKLEYYMDRTLPVKADLRDDATGFQLGRAVPLQVGPGGAGRYLQKFWVQ
jgi:hypothetical protein